MREIESIPLKETRVAQEVNAICAMEEGGERRVFDCVCEREREREREWIWQRKVSRFFRWRHNRPAKPRGKSQWQTYLRIQSFDYLLHVWHCLCDFYPFLFLIGCEFYFLFLNLILPFSIGGIFFIMPYNCGNLRRIWQNPNSFVLLSPTQNLRYFLHSTNFLQSTTVLLLHREVYHSKQGLSSLGSTMVNIQ